MQAAGKNLAILALALAGSLAAAAAPAATRATRGPAVDVARDAASVNTVRAVRAQLDHPAAATRSAAQPDDLRANGYRAYPPSCLSDPLPGNPSGPTWTRAVDLYEVDGSGANSYETVTITLWRVPCSSSQFYNSATLMRIDRQSAYEGDGEIFPVFPDVRVAQSNDFNDIGFDSGLDFVRVAAEPNTVISDTGIGTPVVFSSTYVLENYPSPDAGYFDFNLPFTIRFDNGYLSGGQFFIDVPAYDPTANAGDYPGAFESLPINGYMSSNWYDPAHGGEGIIVQVAEYPPDDQNVVYRALVFDWFTYDDLGIPFWISGNATIDPAHATRVTVPAAYFTDGGFAGNFGSSSTANEWGTVTFEFPDCNDMTVEYAADGDLPDGVPGGTGTLHYQRLLDINGLTCE
jgi:hypothetical protein